MTTRQTANTRSTRRILPGVAVGAAGVLLAISAAFAHAAEAYPTKSIRIVHGYVPGSSMDTNSRAIAQRLTESLGQTVIVEQRPGATGNIAAEHVARSSPDGYTLLAAPGSSVAATPHLRKVGFDTLKDFAPVAIIGEFSYLLAAHPAVPAKNVKELIALARAQPGKLSFGSNGTGSAYHLAGELLAMMAGVSMLHVPYRGGGTSAITDLVTGRIDLMWNNPVFLLPHVRDGKLRALAVSGPKRVAAMPDVPTVGETLKGYEMFGWQGILAPAATPREAITRLDDAIQKALASAEVRKHWTQQGMEAAPGSPEEFGRKLRADYDRYAKLIKKLGKID
jgi:tripartite-type tricarboxylate transporter receptor subunit TctC